MDKAIEDLIEERAKELAEAQLEPYKDEAKRYVTALQEIADGQGKYARIAREAL